MATKTNANNYPAALLASLAAAIVEAQPESAGNTAQLKSELFGSASVPLPGSAT